MCRVPGRQSPAAVANMWLTGSGGVACRGIMLVSMIGSHVFSKVQPSSQHFTHRAEWNSADKRQAIHVESDLKRIKCETETNWCKSLWELLLVLGGKQLLSVCSSSSELTFREFLQEPMDFTPNSPVCRSAVRPLKQAQLKQNHLTLQVIQASFKAKVLVFSQT